MKKHTVVLAAAALMLALAPANTTNARNTRKLDNATTNIVVKQLESNDQYVYLQVNLAQTEEKTAAIRVSDENGEVLYADRFKGRNHVVTLKFLPEELAKLNIELATTETVYRKKVAIENTSSTTTTIREINK